MWGITDSFSSEAPLGIVNLTVGALIPEILLDVLLPNINGFAGRKSRILPIY
jgi:hypothetical protein